ncbi:MAG: M48 family metallopeptidase [Candidatus Eremiobacteraeota bacterium]|nr:M48 family metallopeptidase [Candidatus Eremiobacteraeota bacterium]
MRRFLIGVAAGAVVGYACIRTKEAIDEARSPAPQLAQDPKVYGALRRALMLAGMARSLATLAAAAYALAPALEPAPGATEPRVRRMTLVASFVALSAVVDLPADYVEGIALERRYGLSKQSDADWLAEQAKSLGVTLVVAVPLIEALAFAIDRLPASWPLVATFGSLPLLVLANVVVPTYIAPLFNTFTPIEGDFAERVRALATRFGAGDARLLRVDMSKQTEKANAYVTGLFGTKRIVIGDTLLDRFEADETIFVVAHELGHYVSGDVWRGVGLGMVAAAFVFFGSRSLAQTDGTSLASTAGLARLFFAMSLLGTIAGPPLSAFSRARERAADRFAIAATDDAASGAAAFTRLRERNLAEDEQPKWMEVLFSSHPSLRSRIERLEASV